MASDWGCGQTHKQIKYDACWEGAPALVNGYPICLTDPNPYPCNYLAQCITIEETCISGSVAYPFRCMNPPPEMYAPSTTLLTDAVAMTDGDPCTVTEEP